MMTLALNTDRFILAAQLSCNLVWGPYLLPQQYSLINKYEGETCKHVS